MVIPNSWNRTCPTISSKTADVPSRNLVGLKNEGIDILINLAANAKTRKELNEIIRSLDRSLRSLHIWVPQWYKKYIQAYRNHYSIQKIFHLLI